MSEMIASRFMGESSEERRTVMSAIGARGRFALMGNLVAALSIGKVGGKLRKIG